MSNYEKNLSYIKKNYPRIIDEQKRRVGKVITKFIMYETLMLLVYIFLIRRADAFFKLYIIPSLLIFIYLYYKNRNILKQGYHGEIIYLKTNLGSSNTYTRYSALAPINRSPKLVSVIVKVKDENNKKHTMILPPQCSSIFYKGDKITKLRGFHFPINNSKRETNVCIYCGSVSYSHESQCFECKNDFVTVKEEVNEFEFKW